MSPSCSILKVLVKISLLCWPLTSPRCTLWTRMRIKISWKLHHTVIILVRLCDLRGLILLGSNSFREGRLYWEYQNCFHIFLFVIYSKQYLYPEMRSKTIKLSQYPRVASIWFSNAPPKIKRGRFSFRNNSIASCINVAVLSILCGLTSRGWALSAPQDW